MENIFREYMERAFAERGPVDPDVPRPVVTVSREFGCPSTQIARSLASLLNRRHGFERPGKWRFINKEVVEATARRLGMNPNDVNYNLHAGGQGLIEDVLASFSPNYVSSLRMKRTITAVVRSIAEQGFVIIVGRGGVGILQDFPHTLNIRLIAPLDWRVSQVCQARSLAPAEAGRLTEEMDKKRAQFIEMMMGGKYNPYFFDTAFNCSRLTCEEICHAIINLMETKKMIE
jgi:hypothetical protein